MTSQEPVSLAELAKALSKAQLEMPTISLDRKVNFNNVQFEYASLSNIIANTKPVLAKYGLTILQFPTVADGTLTVETMLLHDSGAYLSRSISAKLPLPKTDKHTGQQKPDDPKDLGALVSYLRRYSWASLIGCALDGDYDAEILMPKYEEGNKEHKVWLKKTLEPLGFTDQETLRKVSSEMMRGNFEMTEDALMRCVESVRR